MYEIGVGTGSAVRYHLLADAHTMAIGLDIMDYRTVVKLICAQLPPKRVEDCMRRFRFVRLDMAKLTFQSMDKQCRQHFGSSVLAVPAPCALFVDVPHDKQGG